jgi:hypothetical protein
MGRRSRQRGRETLPTAPSSEYRDTAGGVLELRGALSPATRRRYAETLHGGLNRDDSAQRATELLFEHLAVAWTVAGVRSERQKELVGRYRMASAAERGFVRTSLRAHLAEHFPDMEAP